MNFDQYKEMMNMQYELLKGLYFNNSIITDNYCIYKSDVISDNFWNILSLNKENILDELDILNEIEISFEKINRQPCIYLPNIMVKHPQYKKYLLDNNYELNDSDAYMVLVDDSISTESKNTTKKVETKEQFDDFMEVMESGYGGEITEDTPYSGSITAEYYEAITLSLNSNQFNHLILYKDNHPVSVATLSYKDGYGVINNVATKREYQNMGLGKELMRASIDKFKELGGGILFLFTESGSKNEKWYNNQGFKTMLINEQYVKNKKK